MALTLKSDVVGNGVDQGSLIDLLTNIKDLINELQEDHATFKTVVTDINTLQAKLLHRSQNYRLDATDPVLAISTNFDVKNTETIPFVCLGVNYTLGDNTVADTGTSKVLTGAKWGAFAYEASTASAAVATWVMGEYASEALALAAAKAMAPTTGKTTIGYVTVLAHASGFTAGTDALTTGSGGNVATTTNYYGLSSPLFTAVSTSAPATLSASTAITLLKG